MGQTILVVDDDIDTQRYLSILLSSQGYDVVGAGEGMEALKLATENPPDLCIVDVMMPGMDGFDLTRQLRRHPLTATLPILLFTARMRDEDWHEGFAAGADEYLTKPARPVEIQRAVANLFHVDRPSEGTRRAFVMGVVGVKKGVGASTLALNLAAAHARDNKRLVTAVEMQPGANSWREELNLDDPSNLMELFRAPGISTGALNRAMNRTAFGLRVLLAGEGHLDGEGTPPERYVDVIQKLARDMDLVVLDMGVPHLPEFPVVLDLLDGLLVVSDPHEGTLANTARLIDYVRATVTGNRTPLDVVVNLVETKTFDIGAAEASLLHSVSMVIEREDELITRARVNFRPAYMTQTDSLLCRRIDELNQRIVAQMRMRKQ